MRAGTLTRLIEPDRFDETVNVGLELYPNFDAARIRTISGSDARGPKTDVAVAGCERREREIGGHGRVACGILASDAIVVQRPGGQARELLRMNGDKRGVQRY